MAFCKRCGKKIDDDASFCNYCGTRVTAVADTENIPVSTPVSTPVATPVSTPVSTPAATPVSTPVSTPSTPVIQEEPAVQPNESLKEELNKPIVNEAAVSEAVVKKKRSKVPLIIVLIIIILAALFAVFWFILKPILFKEDDVIPHNLFNDGLLSAVSKENGKWGYINEKGKFVIKTQFDAVNEFSDGYASVSVGGQWGVIDKTGTYTVSPQYEYISAFSQGVAVVVDFDTDDDGKDQYGLIDTNGDLLMPITYDEIGSDPYDGLGLSSADELFVVKSGEKYGYANIKGEIVINPSYDAASPFYEGYASVCRNEKYGFIDKKGNEVIKCQYDGISNFSENLCVVNVGGKYGMINTKGKYVINPKYSYLTSFSDGYATFEKGDKRGYINEKGKEVIKAQYSAAFNFNNGLAIVRASGKYGIIDNKGNYIVSPQYDELRRLNNNLYSFSLDDFWGLIDGKGNELFSPTYDEIPYAGENDKKYAFEYDGKLGYLSEDGSVSISNKFMIPRCYGKRAVIYDQDSYSGVSDRFYDDGYAIVYTDDRKMAVIDSSGNILNNKEYYGLGGCITNYCEYDGCLNVLSKSDENCSQAHAESINTNLKTSIEGALNLGLISEDIPSKHLIIRKINCSDTSSSDGITTSVILGCSSYKTKGYAVVWYFTDTGECTVFWGHDEKNDLNVGAYSSVSGSLQNDAKGMSLDDIYNIIITN